MADEKNQETITGVASDELSEDELAKASGGDEAPKETVTFEYGGLVIKYGQQSSTGAVKP